MNILLINHYAGSDRLGMEYRPFYLAREWAAAGHAVTIVGASFSHLRQRQPEVDGDLCTTEEDGVRFRWLRTCRYAGNGPGRIANMATFVGKLSAHAGRIVREERPDAVICSSTYPLDIYPGGLMARRAKARLVFEVHDLWPLTPALLGGYSARHPYIRLLQKAEDWAYGHADLVVSVLPKALDYMTGHGLDPARFVHIPNGVRVPAPPGGEASEPLPNGEAARLPAPVAALVAGERGRGRFLVGYAGSMNVSNSLETVCEAARLLSADPVSFVLAGDGSQAQALRAAAARRKLDNFHLVGTVPKRAVQPFLAAMDALVIPWRRSPLYRFGVSPNKMFDYMLSARPVIQAGEAGNDLVAEAQCGFTVRPEDAAALAGAVLRLARLPASERLRLGENGRRHVLLHHDYRVLASRFAAAMAPGRAGTPRAGPEAADSFLICTRSFR